ncbi:hypothetical protein ACA910_003154 [Epithemia clementina (nom. ined.)]
MRLEAVQETQLSHEDNAAKLSTSSHAGGKSKENVCGDVKLRDTAMSASSLSAMSFELPPGFQNTPRDLSKSTDVPDAMYLSSSSSTCTRESDAGAFSDVDTSNFSGHQRLPPAKFDREASDKLNAKVSLRQTSRQGRSSQRWVSDSNERIRLVTGCVPILKGGKIMFVSASGKPEWILPKGGWELDETLEESAIRECFEEAGVLGILGPTLTQVEYETRKAKKRRLEKEQELSNRAVKARIAGTVHGGDEAISFGTAEAAVDLPPLVEARIQEQEELCGNTSEENSSVAPSTYCKVRMTLFPLYVSRVLEKWPEDGRFRKAVDIDEAIQLMENRPEFRVVLEEVKSRGLHLLSQPIKDVVPSFT